MFGPEETEGRPYGGLQLLMAASQGGVRERSEGSGHGTAPRAVSPAPVLELREHWDTSLSRRVWVVLCRARARTQ